LEVVAVEFEPLTDELSEREHFVDVVSTDNGVDVEAKLGTRFAVVLKCLERFHGPFEVPGYAAQLVMSRLQSVESHVDVHTKLGAEAANGFDLLDELGWE
jgi:hypothetical protein